MKIAIITLSIGSNYGGMLQAYALQHFLRKQGHDAVTVWYKGNQRITTRLILGICNNIFKKYILRKDIKTVAPIWMNKKLSEKFYRESQTFINDNIKRTEYLKDLSELNRMHFDAYIVGSDQVWRPKMNAFTINNMFLDFLKDEKALRIAYAASFGVSNWEYPEPLTEKVAKFAKKFNAVSVRENSGVELCEKYLHVDAKHVADPTMLLDANDYRSLISNGQTTSLQNKVFAYILDSNDIKQSILNKIAQTANCETLAIDPNYSKSNTEMPSPYQWLKCINDAEYVFTDSFHGVVFSIIFNKQFYIYGNKQRGLSRFESLLKMFGLENRIVSTPDEIATLSPINYDVVNPLLENFRKYSVEFLYKSLNA
ncbi:MAG: polysaccharide pyruvyl transferase family protein [Bacteroidales bacterium]|nr:polysaccharide pyruvyl transferase family protein [Bacteroidales bacterium]